MQVKNGGAAIPALVSATPVPPLATPVAVLSNDALLADIARLQQQAMTLQTGIRDLRQRETEISSTRIPAMPDLPTLPGMSDLNRHLSADTVLVLPALALAALLLWVRSRRSRPLATTKPIAPPAQFVEKRAAPRPENDPHWVDRDIDFVASDHHSDWGQDVAADIPVDETGSDSRFWEPEIVVKPAAFDSETAAVEVHKVRASLAHKRATRAMGPGPHHALWSDEDDAHEPENFDNDDATANYAHLKPSAPLSGLASVDLELDVDMSPSVQPLTQETVESLPSDDAVLQLGGDLDVDLCLTGKPPLQAQPDAQEEPDLASEQHADVEPEPELEVDTEPPSFSYKVDGGGIAAAAPETGVKDEVKDEAKDKAEDGAEAGIEDVGESHGEGETPCEIKLALAQEFLALGLLPGAREIATDLLGSPREEMREQARALLADIEVQEGIEPMALFESSAFVAPNPLPPPTMGQSLSSDLIDPE
ncbi:MAG: hypothetical protein H7293_00060 [Candidatus Saccharibacteria bacterium]|nr:hypothetical protein [Rhodoferax sp.]